MKKHSRLVFLLLAIVVFIGCQTKSSQNPKDYSDSLIVLPGASNISYGKVNNTDQVWYTLKVEHPASDVINGLQKKIDDQGWMALKEDYLNPGMPTSAVRGWSKFDDVSKQPHTVVHSWNSDWQNKKGDVLRYHLNYRHPINEQPDMSSLTVVAIYVPADVALAIRQASLDMLKKYNKQNSGSK
jgi:hypothetical protein